ncbi:uncharacterized protein N7473_006768 [Penicillium subrubescens]|uniref:uncharacterized protein n=1 Tax=Penicillium subrubescens TaxID=1316194 RepID=UPI00254592F7|nr:uncharacterized protein N7473_006768 [Penicillium subrubescens]KAJ5890540.1 hypothetical protein N7473_006768 [Penicillium subrubescens]
MEQIEQIAAIPREAVLAKRSKTMFHNGGQAFFAVCLIDRVRPLDKRPPDASPTCLDQNG